MEVDTITKQLLIEAFTERLLMLQPYPISQIKLPKPQTPTEKDEEILRKLMVVLRKNPISQAEIIIHNLLLLASAAQTTDLRFIDAFHFYFEIFSKQKDKPENWPLFLSTYSVLMTHHNNTLKLHSD
jgi:hypothetical protein